MAQAEGLFARIERLERDAALVIGPILLTEPTGLDSGPRRAVLRFERAPSAADLEKLRSREVQITGPLDARTWVVRIEGDRIDVAADPKVLVATSVLPDEKKGEALRAGRPASWAFDPGTSTIQVVVGFYSDTPVTDAEHLMDRFEAFRRYGTRTWAGRLTRQQVDAVAEVESVRSIEQGPIPLIPLNPGARALVGSDLAQQADFGAPRPIYEGVSGAGIRVGICDTGIDEGHFDFDAIEVDGSAGKSRVYATDPTPPKKHHGTHVASIVGGSGFNSGQNLAPFAMRGHAPRVEIGEFGKFLGDATLFDLAIGGHGTDLTNHSYVESYVGYNHVSAELDKIVAGDAQVGSEPIPRRAQVWAAGNNGAYPHDDGIHEGYYSVNTQAKNTISVGAICVQHGRLFRGSSLGPTLDGRIKPDLVAPGCLDAYMGGGIQAALKGSQLYVGLQGTSMAAPVVSAAIALMMQQVELLEQPRPQFPSTWKALLIHTAKDLVSLPHPEGEPPPDNPDTDAPTQFHAGPDFATGWGLVDLEAARDLAAKSQSRAECTLPLEGGPLEHTIEVTPGAPELKVTLAWDDPAVESIPTYSPITPSLLINDLDLMLVSPSGAEHAPWTLEPIATQGSGKYNEIDVAAVLSAQTGPDHRNNVEMGQLSSPEAGTWIARVSATVLSRAQPYSLVASHALLEACP